MTFNGKELVVEETKLEEKREMTGCVHFVCTVGADAAREAAFSGNPREIMVNQEPVQAVPFGTFHKPTADTGDVGNLYPDDEIMGVIPVLTLYDIMRESLIAQSGNSPETRNRIRYVSEEGRIFSTNSAGEIKFTGRKIKVNWQGGK